MSPYREREEASSFRACLEGLFVNHRDGAAGQVLSVDSADPWIVLVQFHDGVVTRQDINNLTFMDQPLLQYLGSVGAAPDIDLVLIKPDRVRAWFKYVIPSLPVEGQLAAINLVKSSKEGATVPAQEWNSLIEFAARERSKLPELQLVLHAIPPSIRVAFYTTLDDIHPFLGDVIEALKQSNSERAASTTLQDFWKKHKPSDQADPLFEIAPSYIQTEVWLVKTLPVLSIEGQVAALCQRSSQLQAEHWLGILQSIALDLERLPERRRLLSLVPLPLRFKFFSSLKDLAPYVKEALEALNDPKVHRIPYAELDMFWQRHLPDDPEHPLYAAAPKHIQSEAWFARILPRLAVDEQITALNKRAPQIAESEWRHLTQRIARDSTPQPDLRRLWKSVPSRYRLEFFAKLKDLDPYIDDVIETLQAVPERCESSAELNQFWLMHAPTEPENLLIRWAPKDIQRQVWLTKTLPKLSATDQRSAIVKAASEIQHNQWIGLAKRIVDDLPSNPNLRHLMSIIPAGPLLEFLATLNTLDLYKSEVIGALVKLKASAAPNDSSQVFWARHPPPGLDHFLYPYAPAGVRGAALKAHFKHFIAQVSEFRAGKDGGQSEWDPTDEYGSLTTADFRLADCWSHSDALPVKAQMLSARAAEKAAAQFYRAMGHRVEDTALHQLSKANDDWRTHDLMLDDEIAIDVKNARYPIHNQKFYVEHTIPRFKQDRSSRHVRIAGILSPYLKHAYIVDPGSAKFTIPSIRYLGETSWPDIDCLCRTFTTPKLEVRNPVDRAFPAWLFDFPDPWYQDFDDRSKALRESPSWPSDEQIRIIFDDQSRLALIPKLLAARIDLPQSFVELLSPWQRYLCSRLNRFKPKRITLPQVFLTILSDFLNKLQDAPTGFSPVGYRELIFDIAHRGRQSTYGAPLGLADPLALIEGLCGSIEVLWQHRQALKLDRFVSFRFSGLGLLQGRMSAQSPWETILAYCGGWVRTDTAAEGFTSSGFKRGKKLGRCGNSPLVLGKDPLCPVCHKLICGQCGFCSQACVDRMLEDDGSESPGIRPKNSAPQQMSAGQGSASQPRGIKTTESPPHLDELPPIAYDDYGWMPADEDGL